jgi:hypothetical protein
MLGAKLVRCVQKLRDEIEKAWAEGEELPSFEAGFPIEEQKQLKKLGSLIENLIGGIQEKIEALQESSDDLDELLDVLEALGNGTEAAIKLEVRENEIEAEPEPVHAGETERTDEHKVKGE